MTMLDQALRYAASGMPIFPCWPGTKIPITTHGFEDATTDEDVIRTWWDRHPEANIAFSPETMEWAVVDIEHDGEDGWMALLAEEGEAELNTYQVRTPRGGRHLYYAGSLPGKVKIKLHNGSKANVDTRGRGSYVLLPPSRVMRDDDGTYYDQPYEAINDGTDIAILPDFLIRRTATSDKRLEGGNVTLDTPASLSRVRLHLADCIRQQRVSVTGAGGNDTGFKLACVLLDMGITAASAFTEMAGGWNAACEPPWSEDELARIISNAERYMQNKGGGAKAVAPPSERFAHLATGLYSGADDPEATGDTVSGGGGALQRVKTSAFAIMSQADMEEVRDPGWLIQDLIPQEATCLLAAKSGSYKSFLALELSMAIVYGCETCGTTPRLTGNVVYAVLEGRTQLAGARRKAWLKAREKAPDGPFFLMRAPKLRVNEECQEFFAQLHGHVKTYGPLRLVVLDTLAKVMAGMDEYNAMDAGRMVEFADAIVAEFHCPVLVVAHTGHAEEAQKRVRGSSALPAGFDTLLTMEANRAAKLLTLEVQQHKDADDEGLKWHFALRELAGSIVLDPLTDAQFSHRVKTFDPLSLDKIAAILRASRAIDEASGLSTYVLADKLTPPIMGESLLDREAALSDKQRKLAKLGLGAGKVFMHGRGRDARWWVTNDLQVPLR